MIVLHQYILLINVMEGRNWMNRIEKRRIESGSARCYVQRVGQGQSWKVCLIQSWSLSCWFRWAGLSVPAPLASHWCLRHTSAGKEVKWKNGRHTRKSSSSVEFLIWKRKQRKHTQSIFDSWPSPLHTSLRESSYLIFFLKIVSMHGNGITVYILSLFKMNAAPVI